MEEVLILLAAYNGKRYLPEMIESVLVQDYSGWRLILSDDGSTDGTPEILQEYARRYPEKISFHCSGYRLGNAQNHFMYLLEKFHDAPYIMFCDQDDVWHSDKISKTLAKMKEIEIADGPAMVHTDLRVVDQELKVIHPSFLERSALRGDRMLLNQLLVQNVVTGCTMMINRSLAELACTNIPQEGILMHDWWLALLASACGVSGFLNEATIEYRQHTGNSVGAKDARSLRYILSRLKTYDMAKNMRLTFGQAKEFHRCYARIMSKEQCELICSYAQLENRGGIARRWAYIRYGYWKCGLYRQIGQMILG